VIETKLKFALVGCGYIGKQYIRLLSQHSECRLTALIDTDKNRLSEYSALNIPLFESPEKFFASNTGADAVVVATPNSTHASIAIAFLKNNHHVLVEKPMALKCSDAEQMMATAKEKEKKLAVVLQNRFAPVSVWLKQLVQSQILGRIFFVEVNCFWNRDERYYKKEGWHGTKKLDGGSLFTQFSHFIDVIYWLFGDIKNIASRFSNFNHGELIEFEDTGSIQFELEQGGMGCFNFSTAVWNKSFESSMTIISENGSVKISGQYMDRIEYCHVKNYQLPTELKEPVAVADNHLKMLETFVQAVGEDRETNAREALYSVNMIERMYAASSELSS
jgi:predicted dehydrogenase